MACVNPDGTLTPSAISVIEAARSPVAPAQLAGATALPLYRVRASLRELVEAGLLAEREGLFVATDAALDRLRQLAGTAGLQP